MNYVIEVRRLENGIALYVGRDGQLNCRALEEARVYSTTGRAAEMVSRVRGTLVPVEVGQRTKGRGAYAKARA